MKKILAFLMASMILAAVAAPGLAQGRDRRCVSRSRSSQTYQTYYDNSRAYDDYNQQSYYDYNQQYRGRSLWDRHRDKITLATGVAGGAALGGPVCGGQRAGNGAPPGFGGCLLFTFNNLKPPHAILYAHNI